MQVIDARGRDRLDRPWRSSALERHRWPLCRRPTEVFVFDI